MADAVKRLSLEESGELFVVTQVRFHAYVSGAFLKEGVAVALKLDRVVVVEVVDADDGMAEVEKFIGQMESDEAGGAGDEDVHITTFHRRCREAKRT